MPVVEKTNSKLRGAEVEKEYQSQLGDGEMDPDLIDAIDAIAHAGAAVAAEQAEALEGTFDDMVRDLSSWRWLHFYSVPKVKLAVHLCFYPNPNPNPDPIPNPNPNQGAYMAARRMRARLRPLEGRPGGEARR